MSPQSPLSLTQESIQNLLNQSNNYASFQNNYNLTNYKNACTDWMANNLRNRDNKIQLTIKPIQPLVVHVNPTLSQDGTSISFNWSQGPDYLGDPCPDLPEVNLPAGFTVLGQQLTGVPGNPTPGVYFASGIHDTTPGGKTALINGHSYLKVQSPGAMGTNSDGSVPGWYLMLS